MGHIEVGVDGKAFAQSKKAFKTAVAAVPHQVWVTFVGVMGPSWSGYVADMPEEHTLQVVGPDPHRKRNWYAAVNRSGTKITVK